MPIINSSFFTLEYDAENKKSDGIEEKSSCGTEPFGLSFKQRMFNPDGPKPVGVTRGFQPSPTVTPRGSDPGGADAYVD